MNQYTKTVSDNPTEDKLARKAYQSPELVLYGNISEITRMVDMTGMMDGGTGQMDKT